MRAQRAGLAPAHSRWPGSPAYAPHSVVISCATIDPKPLDWPAIAAVMVSGLASFLLALLASCATCGKRPAMLKCVAVTYMPLILYQLALCLALYIPKGFEQVMKGKPQHMDYDDTEKKVMAAKVSLGATLAAQMLLVPAAYAARHAALTRGVLEARGEDASLRSSELPSESSERMEGLRGYAAEQRAKTEGGKPGRAEKKKKKNFDARMAKKYGSNWNSDNRV